MIASAKRISAKLYPYRHRLIVGCIAGFALTFAGVVLGVNLPLSAVLMLVTWWFWVLYMLVRAFNPTDGPMADRSTIAGSFPFFRHFFLLILIAMFVAPLVWGVRTFS